MARGPPLDIISLLTSDLGYSFEFEEFVRRLFLCLTLFQMFGGSVCGFEPLGETNARVVY
jgi:hypothetical protein